MDRPFDPSLAPDENFRIPDLAEAVEGWRAWGVPADPPPYGAFPKLYSVSHSQYFWVPRREMIAECEKCPDDDLPGEKCGCGFYSAKTLEHLMSMGYHQYDAERQGMFHVVGRVANWGKVIPATQGWRAQKSYPIELFIPFEAHRLAQGLKEAYGVPVRLKNTLKPVRGEEVA